MTSFDRRSMLLALSGSALVSSCRTVANSNMAAMGSKGLAPVVRKKWVVGKNDEHQQKYIKAVELLKANDAKFPDITPAKAETMARDRKKFPEGYFLSWKGLVQIHYSSCQHQNWYLLPYHRLYLLYFEAACQIVLEDSTFALPYWDWSEDQKVPDEFYDVPVLNEVRTLKKGEALPAEALVDPSVILSALSYDFKKFHSYEQETPNPFIGGGSGGSGFGGGPGRQGSFEAGPHNGVHNFVGGMMADPKSSPTDPVFWLHHANIDRLWGIWLAKNSERVLPFLTLTEEERKLSEGFGKAWGESEVKLDLILNRPWGLESALARQDAGLPSGLRPDEEQILQLLRVFPPLPPTIISTSEKNHSASVSLTVRELIAADTLPYFYDTDPETVGLGPTISTAVRTAKPEMLVKPKEVIAEGTSVVTASQITTTVSIGKVGSDDLSTVSIVFENLRVPMEAELRSRFAIYYFIARADKKASLPKTVDAKSRKLESFAGSQTLFLVNHNHGGTEVHSHKVSGIIDLSDWAKKDAVESKGFGGSYVIRAIAVDVKNGFKPIELFNKADQSGLGLRYLAEH